MRYNIEWFYIYSVAVCFIVLVFLWRYSEHAGNKEYMTDICYRYAFVGLLRQFRYICYFHSDLPVAELSL